ncbi:energy transducer TonB [Mucilaginibacter sp.]
MMFKSLFLLAFCLFLFIEAKAQQNNPPGTIIYFRDKAGRPTDKEHVSDVIFIYPADSSSGKKMYPVKEFYIDGTVKLTGTSSTSSSRPILEGRGITYYPNGQKKSIGSYKYGVLTGDVTFFYPNGKFNSIENYDKSIKLLITCKDSAGNVLAENGNGKWMEVNYIDNDKIISEGTVKDSLQEGEWHETINDSIKLVTLYKKGEAILSDVHNQELNQIFAAVEQEPEFPNGGAAGFVSYLGENIRYPSEDVRKHVSGKVRVTFVVEKDGSLTEVKAINAPSETIAAEIIKVVGTSPRWSPGMQNGLPVRVQYTILFMFSMAK